MGMANRPITVLIADDHPLLRRGVAGVLDEEIDLVLAGQAADAAETIRLAGELKPDVVLLDIHMPGDGLEALRVMKQNTSSRVLMMTFSDVEEDLLRAIAAGADGYILKNSEPAALCRAIRQVAAGQSVLAPELTATVMHAAARPPCTASGVDLTVREQEVLHELARGATTAAIAETLSVSHSTVKTHISHILEKLVATNRAEAVSRAAALGLLDRAI